MDSQKNKSTRLPVVAIIGRPNVGKSTLFNRLVGKRQAIVDDRPGVTRDRIYGVVRDQACPFLLVDTGGLDPGAEEDTDIQLQVRAAIAEADILIFMLDVRSGITPLDQVAADLIRRAGKPVLYVANKADAPKHEDQAGDLYEIGADHIIPISAEHGRGVPELAERICDLLPGEWDELPQEEDVIRVAVVGRPNVGKSTLVNRLAGQQRVVVSDRPGTTRDAVDVEVTVQGRRYRFVDTAGVRKKSKVHDSVEFFSVLRAIRSIEEADVVVLMMDAMDPATEQDKRLAGLVNDRGRGLVLAVNKFDLAKGTPEVLSIPVKVRETFFFARFAPIVRLSAKTGMNVHKLIETIEQVSQNRTKRISTGELNRFLHEVIERHPPPSRGTKRVKIFYITQVRTSPPVIAVFCNRPGALSDQYKRYIVSRFREYFGFDGVPIRLVAKAKHKEPDA